MRKKIVQVAVFVACSALTSLAAADAAPATPTCRCEVPGASSSLTGPIEQGAAGVVFAMGVAVVLRRNRRR